VKTTLILVSLLTDKRVLQDNRNYLNQTAESFRTFGLDPKVPNLPAGHSRQFKDVKP
jgi:hypothetical protein